MKGSQNLTMLGIKGLLKPAVRFALGRAVRIQSIIELLKEVFVEVVEEDLKRDGIESNLSKLSAATGLQRKDIQRLRSGASGPKTPTDLISRVVGAWQIDRRFLTKAGKPKQLTLEGKAGSFVDLVNSVSTDLNPYTVLFELERSGSVEKNENIVKLVRQAYQPVKNSKEGMELMSEDALLLMSSVSENIFGKQDVKNLHIRTFYDNISPAKEAELRRWVLAQGRAFHDEARLHLSQLDRDLNPSDEPARGSDGDAHDEKLKVSVVTFSFTEKQ